MFKRLRHYLRGQSQGHGIIDRLEERCTDRGSWVDGGGFFSSLARISEEGLTNHSPPALFFLINEDQLAHTNSSFFRPGSVHSGSAK